VTALRPGDRIRFSGEGVVQAFSALPGAVTVRLADGTDAVLPESVAVEQVMPPWWPPQVGDLIVAGELADPVRFLAVDMAERIGGRAGLMVADNGGQISVDDVISRYGPLRLVDRARDCPASGAVSGEMATTSGVPNWNPPIIPGPDTAPDETTILPRMDV
jgi:hypothetical protein